MSTGFRQVLQWSIAKGASDVHAFEGQVPYARINGKLSALSNVLTRDDFIEFTRENDIVTDRKTAKDVGIDFEGRRIRVNYYSTIHGRAVAMRILPKSIPTPQELRLPKEVVNIVNLKRGLVIVSGVTGSGKSTTLASLIEKINQEQATHIITAEEPVEYVYKPKKSIISQREVGMNVNSFAEAARDAMRQRPDIVLLGESRDQETITEAVKLAKTGQLLLTTIHSDNAASVIDRITDMYPESVRESIRVELVNILECVVHQMLVPTMNGELALVAEVLRATTPIKAILKKETKIETVRDYIRTSRDQGCLSRLDCIKELRQHVNLDMEALRYLITDTEYKLLTKGRL